MTLTGAGLATVLGSGGLAAVVGAISRRGMTRVEVVDKLTEVTFEWADQLKADAREARTDAREARAESAEARREAADMRRQLSDLAAELRAIHAAIWDPDATIERLRAVISANGRH